jgi:hypothetical protein
MTEILLVALALSLGAVIAFLKVYQHFHAVSVEQEVRHQVEMRRLINENRSLKFQLDRLCEITAVLAEKKS